MRMTICLSETLIIYNLNLAKQSLQPLLLEYAVHTIIPTRSYLTQNCSFIDFMIFKKIRNCLQKFKGCRMGRSDKVPLWYVSLLINTRFRFFILE